MRVPKILAFLYGGWCFDSASTLFLLNYGSVQIKRCAKDLRFSSKEVCGAALWAQERYLHLCAFTNTATNAEGSMFSTRISRPSDRRRF